MVSNQILAILAGLASAASFGASDFGGGFTSRRNDPYVVVLVGQFVGLLVLLLAAILLSEPLPPAVDLIASAVAGMLGSLGVVRFYRELSGGRMGVVAPLTAVVTVAIPVLFGVITEGLPQLNQLAGILLALFSVWLITRSANHGPVTLRDMASILLTGLLFSIFIVVIGTVSERSIVWPLVASRLASIPILVAIIAFTPNRSFSLSKNQLPLMGLIGLLDVGGSSFFALSSALGRLDIAAVLASLYPAVTVLLARVVLSEQISGRQWFGIALAIAAIVLITL
jgi:drug/metabolite transporter (DMT)-like permease